jgi:hypothetical protein
VRAVTARVQEGRAAQAGIAAAAGVPYGVVLPHRDAGVGSKVARWPWCTGRSRDLRATARSSALYRDQRSDREQSRGDLDHASAHIIKRLDMPVWRQFRQTRPVQPGRSA